MGKFFQSLRKVEDRPTPPEVYNLRIWLLTLAASMGAVIYGCRVPLP